MFTRGSISVWHTRFIFGAGGVASAVSSGWAAGAAAGSAVVFVWTGAAACNNANANKIIVTSPSFPPDRLSKAGRHGKPLFKETRAISHCS
ncbi:hypothetical protein [Sphingomonas changbaiensis]|uniref:hypothetical protein n=1 Tax=Sphingomonas changbaiensis TaxID=529705 RepID=UPI0014703080|nr:hypothetical protein [Sphingomonas changbaiensis]